jgi:hypothetical protein
MSNPPKAFDSSDVLLVRVSPRGLDGDNLQGALKAVRDGVTDWFSGGLNESNKKGMINDRDGRIRWMYQQKKGPPKHYAVEIWISWENDMGAYRYGSVYEAYKEDTAIIVDACLCMKCMDIGRPTMVTGKPCCVGCGQEFAIIIPREEHENYRAAYESQGKTSLREGEPVEGDTAGS